MGELERGHVDEAVAMAMATDWRYTKGECGLQDQTGLIGSAWWLRAATHLGQDSSG